MLHAFLAVYALMALVMFLVYMGVSWMLYDTARLEEHYPGTFLQHANASVAHLPAARKVNLTAGALWALAGLLWFISLPVFIECICEVRRDG